jgi:ABC-type nitrate/sulfonate/bicarbonate transport system permease component
LACGAAGVFAFLALWEVLTRTEILPSDSIPTATSIIGKLFEILGGSLVWHAVGATMKGWAFGLVIGFPSAVLLGLIIGSSEVVYGMLRPIIEFLRPVPSVALVPVGVLIFGVELEVKVFLIVYAVVFPVLFQTIYGVRSTDKVALEMARVYGLGRVARTVRVVLPSTAPYLITGLRLASSIALIIGVTVELIVGIPGLGFEIGSAQAIGDYKAMYAFILLTGVLGVVLDAAFRAVEKRSIWWRSDRREARSA